MELYNIDLNFVRCVDRRRTLCYDVIVVGIIIFGIHNMYLL